MKAPLDGRVAIVTGASRGIGKGVALALGRAGAHVALSARHTPDLEAAVAELQEGGIVAMGMVGDAGDPEDVRGLVTAVVSQWGRVDVAVANAGGVERPVEVASLDVEEFNRCLRLNTIGVFILAQAVSVHMRANGFGRIVTVASRAAVAGGVIGPAGIANAHYAAAKAGAIGFTKALALELAGTGVTANVVAPGPIATELFLSRRDDDELARLRREIPVRRLGDVGDVADAVVYLASDAGYVTAQTLHVNGGTWVG